MATLNLSGIAKIGDEGVKKHFRNFEAWQPLFELAWNGFDASAKTVTVEVTENELHAVETVTVHDNGDGIDLDHIEDNFGRFNDSLKKEDMAQQGSHGRGRLSFYRLSHRAAWWTKFNGKDALIEIKDDNITRFVGDEIAPARQHARLREQSSGTLVELTDIHTNLPQISQLHAMFSVEFGWSLALNQDRKLYLNGALVAVPSHEISEKELTIGKAVFTIKVIRWNEKPTSENSKIYLLDSAGRVRYKQLSSFNKKANFFVSIYVQSSWADKFSSEGNNLFNTDTHTVESEEWKKLGGPLYEFIGEVYEQFLRDYVEGELKKYDEEGIFPNYTGLEPHYAKWRAENTREIVRLVYLSDPSVMNSLNKKQKKIIVRLLDRLSVSNENDAILQIISEVLDLDDLSLSHLSHQLKHTQLKNIISTIELLQQRQLAVDKLRQLMNDHYREVRETPDLQQIIENNTWLFGNQYETIGAEEDTFTNVARGLRDAIKGIKVIDEDDVEDDTDVEGVNRQTDLFMARKIPSVDSMGKMFYRCIVIEIKRPGIALNHKHLRQLDEYAAIIKRHPAFSSEHLQFELILVGRKISSSDFEIKSRLQNQISKNEMGLVSADFGMKRYVMNWYTLLDGFELTHGHLLKTLELRRDELASSTKENLVKELQETF
ncbi:ATP-binding protein [Pseudoduganella sp. OTU4001]|uniref:ATP-binding protein n=1 Tax=Pseudoduganella sp. OTU4001 TaxID=3043854 RepID=UPI00313C2405